MKNNRLIVAGFVADTPQKRRGLHILSTSYAHPQYPYDAHWHLLERSDGSVSVYYTGDGSGSHFVVWDSLDEA